MRISDWSSDVCSSDLPEREGTVPMPFTPAIAVITDEVAEDIGGGLGFAARHGLDRVDIRSVDGRNVILFDDEELSDLALRLKDAGLTVGCYCSPDRKSTRLNSSH